MYPADSISKVPLSEEGRREIKESAQKIKDLEIAEIYTSDFLRTVESVKIVKKEIGFKKDPITDSRLRDVHYGRWCGKKKEEFYEEFPIDSERFERAPEGGESWNRVKERILDFLKEKDKKKRGNILIVSHGDPLWILKSTLEGLTEKEMVLSRKVKKNYPGTGEFFKLY